MRGGRGELGAPRRLKLLSWLAAALLDLLVILLVMLAGCQPPLPEAGSPAARLYQARCGSCHRAYGPRSLTAAMWAMQVEAMQPKLAAAGQAPLTPEEQQAILAYLRRNAGGQ